MITATQGETIAALDLGSNSFHLLIGRFVAGHFQILGKEKIRVQLAQGLDENGHLDPEAMTRGLDALAKLCERLKDITPESIRAVATYTLRKAGNRQQFLQQARSILPCPIEIISGHEEARLIYQGVAHTQPGTERRLVIDIGGGSTEFIIGEQFEPLLLNSLNLGCVTFSQRYFADGQISEKRFKRAELAAARLLAPIGNSYRKASWKTALGCSGTVKAIAGCLQALGHSEPLLTPKLLDKLAVTLVEDGAVSERRFADLDPRRVKVLPGGLAILRAAFRELEIQEMRLSDAALREGLVYEMEERMQHHDIRERTATSLALRYHIDDAQAARVQETSLALYQAVKESWDLSGKKLKPLLHWASLLHELGTSINFRGFHRHGAYILAQSDLPGFNAEEQEVLATLVLHQRKRLTEPQLPALTLYQDQDVLRVILLLRLGTLLHMHRSESPLPFTPQARSQRLTLTFDSDWLQDHPLLASRLAQESKDWSAQEMALIIE